MLLDEAIRLHLARVEPDVRDVIGQRSHAAVWLRSFPGRDLRELAAADIEAWKHRRIVVEHRASETVRGDLYWLRKLYRYAIRDGLAEVDPTAGVTLPRRTPGRVRYLLPSEERALRAQMHPDDWLLVELAIATGMRRGEQFGLRAEHVDLAARWIVLPRGKNNDARRVALGRRALRILRAWGMPERGYVFAWPDGRPLNGAWFARVFRQAVRRAGVADFRWHDLRHTYASRLAMRGVSIQTISRLLGHRSIVETMRYAHLCEQHLHDAVDRL